MTYKQIFSMSGVVPIPVIRVIYSGISGEGQECARNLPFPERPVNGGNAAKLTVPIFLGSFIN